ncbi:MULTISPECIES: ABC transporter substrate-binding protein [Paenarthrobacter]|uniref:Osmoprotectant transport system substrate-binding protein n=1 Tax=Paenarthrobacter nicotinovorans TaxID=29320 RepID=A0ABT9TH45_PAENI|nr:MULTISPECIES: ABC transporter substrate-binding protein [Paenarthrobacter]KIA72195.1 glycine betaine/choline-binding protein of an ABC-type transport system [Arthrobacter sp. MWB30]KQR06287.1 glycine/betaine ABC transporter substrate-binding protein [Arthrobacter sp. Leaf145]SKB34243.1 osmoprotectant transport system substrate-binding protein [Arthrobacter sp. 31Cvi3.1E]BCW11466.1 putative amino acid ABC transporter, substrate binding protein [Arthrobacter sp. NtRootA2]BCW15550.1 putative a
MKNPVPMTLTRRGLGGLAAGVGVALALSACGGSPLATPSSAAPSGSAGGSLVVGSADFPESQVIAEIYVGALNAAGLTATSKPNIGSREIYFKAVQDGSIDLVPDYSGNLLSFVDTEAAEVSADDVYKALPGKLPEGLGVLEASKAEDKDAMVVTKATAEKYQLKSIEDLAKVCKDFTMAAPATFETRSYGFPGLKKNYNCELKGLQPFSDGGGNLTLQALLEDKVQVADIYTTTPSIVDNDLVVLEDPKNNFKAQQVLPLYNKAKMTDKAKEALNNVSKILTTDDLINLNRAVSGDQKQAPKDAAAAWLKDKGIVK